MLCSWRSKMGLNWSQTLLFQLGLDHHFWRQVRAAYSSGDCSYCRPTMFYFRVSHRSLRRVTGSGNLHFCEMSLSVEWSIPSTKSNHFFLTYGEAKARHWSHQFGVLQRYWVFPGWPSQVSAPNFPSSTGLLRQTAPSSFYFADSFSSSSSTEWTSSSRCLQWTTSMPAHSSISSRGSFPTASPLAFLFHLSDEPLRHATLRAVSFCARCGSVSALFLPVVGPSLITG